MNANSVPELSRQMNLILVQTHVNIPNKTNKFFFYLNE